MIARFLRRENKRLSHEPLQKTKWNKIHLILVKNQVKIDTIQSFNVTTNNKQKTIAMLNLCSKKTKNDQKSVKKQNTNR